VSLLIFLDELIPGFLKISKETVDNDLVWFDVLSQAFTSGALVEGVMETLEGWREIRKDYDVGNIILWLASQPKSKC
jgi:hypothetical protein